MGLTPATNRQIPDHSIMDAYNKQTYLGNAYIASTGSVTVVTGGTETPLMLLSNPASNYTQNGQGMNLSCFHNLRKLITPFISAGTTELASFKFYLNPTVSAAGTAITPINLRPGNASTSKMVPTKSPTVSVNGTLLTTYETMTMETDGQLMFILDPGFSILVTVTYPTGTNGSPAVSELTWYEM